MNRRLSSRGALLFPLLVPDAAFLAVVFWMALVNRPAKRHVSGHDRVQVMLPSDVSFSEGELQQQLAG